MSRENDGKSVRRTAGVIVLVLLMAAAIGLGCPARAEEDPYSYCRKMLITGVARSVAIAVITPADFKYYYFSTLAGYEWCIRYL